jgi:hypothetical protein
VTKPDEKTIRALELVAKGIPSAAICERLGITRNRLYQIKHYAEKPRRAEQQFDGATE